MKTKHTPPRWANRFLEWYCRPDLLEEIQGDVYEVYDRTVTTGKRKADWQFIWNVIRFFRLKNIRKSKSHSFYPITMLKSYFTVGLRNAIRNGSTSLINVGGLALGVAGAITIFVFADQFFHTDDQQKNISRIYEITNVINRENKSVTTADVPLALGPALQAEVPGIESMVRFEVGSAALRVKENVFTERIYYTDTTFFDIFNYPFVEGNTTALHQPQGIVLTHDMAIKYFGDMPCLGQPISIKFAEGKVQEFTVTAVVDPPANNSLYFDFLLPISVFMNLKQPGDDNWKYLVDGTFVLMKPGHGPDEMNRSLTNLVARQQASSPEWMTEAFTVYSLTDLQSRSGEIESLIMGSGEVSGILTLLIIAFALLLLACFNYMNISVATVSLRLKEIGIRKVIGSSRGEIIRQFMAENLLMCVAAIGVGLAVSYFLFMPWLNALLEFEIPFGFSSGWIMFFFFGGLLLLIVLVSGVYPATYISQFKPVTILKGKEKFGVRSWFSRSLLTVQFILSFTTIVGCFIFIDNSLYLERKDWGYNHDQNVVVPLVSSNQYHPLRDQIATQKHIMSQAGSVDHISWRNPRTFIDVEGTRHEIIAFQVGFHYLETMNIRLKEGRLFEEGLQSDKEESVVVNEKFVAMMGWEKGVGQIVEYDSMKRVVVGVVQDFHHNDFYNSILPVMFSIAPEEQFRYVTIKVEAGHMNETQEWLRETWRKVAPDDPYEGKLQDEAFANWSQNNSREMKLMMFIASLTTVLACLGLFGLVSYNITRRMKEFSIRKVFGASVAHVFRLMNRDYVWILAVAFVIGAPLGFLLMDGLVQEIYVDAQPTGPIPFIISIGLMVLTVAITIGTQMRKVVTENPTVTLRSE